MKITGLRFVVLSTCSVIYSEMKCAPNSGEQCFSLTRSGYIQLIPVLYNSRKNFPLLRSRNQRHEMDYTKAITRFIISRQRWIFTSTQGSNNQIYGFPLTYPMHFHIQGRVVRKPINVNPGIKGNCSIIFSCLKMFFKSTVWCSLRYVQLKTARQTI